MGQGSVTVELSGALTIQRAAEIRDSLAAALSEGRDILVDCRAADETDLSFVQMLLSARRSAQAAGIDFQLASPLPQALATTLDRGGFSGVGDEDKGFWSGRSV
jgi:anti-anti-sigma regulatory factor